MNATIDGMPTRISLMALAIGHDGPSSALGSPWGTKLENGCLSAERTHARLDPLWPRVGGDPLKVYVLGVCVST